jgi:hypothetical protein
MAEHISHNQENVYKNVPHFDLYKDTLIVIAKLSPNSSFSWAELALISSSLHPPHIASATKPAHIASATKPTHPTRKSRETSNLASVGIPELYIGQGED